MRAHELDEWTLINDQNFPYMDFSNGQIDGRISSHIGVLEVKIISSRDQQAFGVEHKNRTVAYIGIEHLKNSMYYVKNAWVDYNYQKQGLAKELMMYLLNHKSYKLLSDEFMTRDGVKLWMSFMKTTNRSIKIYNRETNEIYDVNDVGKHYKDGRIIMKPEFDDQENPGDQKFFYLIEGSNKISKHYDSDSLFPPYRIFNEGF